MNETTGEVTLAPIPCGRNGCVYCRPRNVQITAAMMGLNALDQPHPPSQAVLSTTREWVDDATLREGWRQMARRVRREVEPGAGYAWFREWTTGRNDGVRRTHYHSLWNRLDNDQGQAVASISHDVWGRIAGAYSEQAHGAQRVWDAGGVARYVAGLAGHHQKSGQAPPAEWSGRRFGTSRGWYATEAGELRSRAESAVRDERIRYRLMMAMIESWATPGSIPLDLVDELVTEQLERVGSRPKPRVVPIGKGHRWL